jgi:hypothetical protein
VNVAGTVNDLVKTNGVKESKNPSTQFAPRQPKDGSTGIGPELLTVFN